MLPDDLLRYCQTNRLVDTILGRGENPVSTHPFPYHQHQHQAVGAAAGAASTSRLHPGPPPTSRGGYY